MRPWILPIVVALGCVAFVAFRSPPEADTSALEAEVTQLRAEVQDLRAAAKAKPAAAPEPVLVTRPGPTAEELDRKMTALEERIAALVLEQKERARPVARKPVAKPSPPRVPLDAAGVQKWIEKLQDENAEVVFTATIELAKGGSLDAVDPLRETLRGHTNFWPRLGAATALGDLYGANAMQDLIDALIDKEELVRSAAANAMKKITRKDFGYVQGLSLERRRALQETARDWWRNNEHDVRERLTKK